MAVVCDVSNPPPGYPKRYERAVRLRDGRRVRVRPIVPADAPELAAAIREADPETVHSRFLGARPPTTPAVLTRLTTVDYVHRFALVAADAVTSRGVGIGRYESLGDGVAEVAVAVDPAWRRVGLATALVELLAEAAVERGIHTFSASYLAENRAVSTLLAEAGGDARSTIRQGFAESQVDLDTALQDTALPDAERAR